MALIVTSVELGNEFNGVKTSWLKHLKGEKIDVNIKFTVKTAIKIFSTLDNSNKLEYASSSFLTPDFIQTENASFQEFYVGDTIQITDVDMPVNSGTYIVIEKPDNNTFRLNTDVTAGISSNAIIKVVDVVDKVKFRFNFIENDEALTFLSKVDGNIQEIESQGIVQGATTPSVAFVFNGNKSWQIGKANITPDGYDADGYPQFIITGYFTMTPLITLDDWNNLKSNIPPNYFYDFKCLKFVYRIEASYVGRSPYINQSYEDALTLGDSGWYAEQFNNTPTNFVLSSFVMLDVNSNVITKLIATTNQQTFTAVITNTVDLPFDANTKFLVQFYIAPETLEEYKNTGQNLGYNFRHDRALQFVGNAAINGEQYGVANRQVLKTIAGTLNSSSQITITGTIAMDAALVAYLLTLNNPRYVLEVITGVSELNNAPLQTDDGVNLTTDDGVQLEVD